MGTQLQRTILSFNTTLNKPHQGMAGFSQLLSYSWDALNQIILSSQDNATAPTASFLLSVVWKPYNRKLLNPSWF